MITNNYSMCKADLLISIAFICIITGLVAKGVQALSQHDLYPVFKQSNVKH